MQHDEFIGQVESRARLSSRGEAERATRAVLETLGERLPEGETKHLAAQLPAELGRHLESASGPAADFGLDGFTERVAEKQGAENGDASFHARCVVEVVQEAVAGGEMEDVRRALPAEFAPLFEAGSQGAMN